MLKYVDILKVIGIILVVFGHSTKIYTGDWIFTSEVTSDFYKNLTWYIYTFHMPLFVSISGILYYNSNVVKKKYTTIKILIQNKYKRLIIPYFTVAIFFSSPIWIILNLKEDSFLKVIFYDIFLGKECGHLWYLLMLFVLFIMFYALEPIIRCLNWKMNIFIFLVLHILSQITPNLFMIDKALNYLIYFYIGYLIMDKYDYIYEYLIKRYKIILAIAILSIVIICILQFRIIIKIDGIVNILLSQINQRILSILNIMMIYIVIFIASDNLINIIKRSYVFRILDKYNFSIYLFHEPIIFIILYFISTRYINPTILVGICFTLSIIISILILKLIRKVSQ